MGIVYGAVLQDAIYREIAQIDYEYTSEDKVVLQKMLHEINELSDYKFNYLCELSLLKNPKGSGEIYLKYFPQFESQTVKAILALQIAYDIGKKGAETVFQGYLDFKKSAEYLQGPANVIVGYDNSFRKMKPQKLKNELMILASNLLDVYYLPFTIRMLASWKISELEEILWRYLDDDYLSDYKFGLDDESATTQRLEFRRNQVKFTALEGLKYYPSDRYIKVLQQYEKSENTDFVLAAKKLKKYLEKHHGNIF